MLGSRRERPAREARARDALKATQRSAMTLNRTMAKAELDSVLADAFGIHANPFTAEDLFDGAKVIYPPWLSKRKQRE